MEIEKLASALEETILFLEDSHPADQNYVSLEEVIGRLALEVVKLGMAQPIDAKYLKLLFAPTGMIQETALENGWAGEFLRISEVVDQFTDNGI